MPSEFRDKVAFITGGASGIGRAAALQLAALGARVVIADVQLGAAQETVRVAEESGGVALAITMERYLTNTGVDVFRAALGMRALQIFCQHKIFDGIPHAARSHGRHQLRLQNLRPPQ